MFRCSTAYAVLVAALALAASDRCHASSPPPLPLDEAFARVVDRHPDLRRTESAERLLLAERDRAAQTAPLMVGAAVENAFGRGDYQAFDGAEISLTLASVFERDGKRAARQTLARRRLEAVSLQREAARLDLLAEVARRYLDLVAAQAGLDIAAIDIEQRERAVSAAARRVEAGASPASVRLSADAALVRARLERQRLKEAADTAWRRLAILWGESMPGPVPPVAGDVLALPSVPDAETLRRRVDESPALRTFADEQRIREARLRLAQTERTPDIDWQVGIRQFQSGDDWALLGSVSIPLGGAARAEPGIRAAQAELDALEIEREGGEFALYAVLADAYGRYRAAVAEVGMQRDELLPLIVAASAAAEAAWRAGASSYLEWAQLQSEHIAARRQQLAAAVEGQRALIEIQRLIAEPFVLSPAAVEGRTP